MRLDFTSASPQTSRFPSQPSCQPQSCEQSQPKSLAVHPSSYHMGDDCAINELLEGRMDLDVVLPDSKKVRLTVDRRTPMMDLLVQAASATKISPAGHTIHVFGDNGKGATLQYKPSTPIGSLDANTICIVPKKDSLDSASGKRAPKVANRPFEPTFRVQVHLPRNQLTVTRVSPKVTISELRAQVCQEKGLDPLRYQLVRPSDPGQPINGEVTLAEYGSTEITLLSNSCIESHVSTAHIMSYPKDEQKTRKTTGILRLIAEDHSKFPNIKTQAHTQPDVAQAQRHYKPKKRRPAPPPPTEPNFHSRQSSSDSSGYHEVASSSYLREETSEEKASSDSSGVSSLDAKVGVSSLDAKVSVSNQDADVGVNVTKKRKAPLPPSSGENEEEKSGGVADELKGVKDKVEQPVLKVEECVSNGVKEQNSTVEESKPPYDEPVCEDDEAVTKAALLALNARIEQNVTEQEIASSIQAAFNECARAQPCLLTIKTSQEKDRTKSGLSLDCRTTESDGQLDSLKTVSGLSILGLNGQVGSNGEVEPLKTVEPKLNRDVLDSGINYQCLNGQTGFECLKTDRPQLNGQCNEKSGVDNVLIGQKSEPVTSKSFEKISVNRNESLKVKCDSGLGNVREADGLSSGSLKKSGLVKDTAGLSNYRLESAKEKCGTTVYAKINGTGQKKATSNGLSNYHFGSLKCESTESKKSVKSVSDEQRSVKPALSNYSIGSLKTKSESEHLNSFEYGVGDGSLKPIKEQALSTSNGLTKHYFGSLNAISTTTSTDNSHNLQISSVRLLPKDKPEEKNSKISITVKDLSRETSNCATSKNVSENSFHISKTIVSLKPENNSLSQTHSSSISNKDDFSIPEKSKDLYPLQKSSVRLSFERKDVEEEPLEAVLPPPAEFRTAETDKKSSPIEAPSEFRSDKTATSAKIPTEPRNVESSKKTFSTEFRKLKPSPAQTTKTIRRSSSLLNLAPPVFPVKSTTNNNQVKNLQRSLSDLSIDDKLEFETEQARLRLEYAKLQRQFVLWQQQLMSNHAMLSEECLAPNQYARTLQHSHSLPEGEDQAPPCPLVARSLSYEPTRSTLPRSAINIPELELGSTTNVSNGSSTLRSSKTKSYFKPPQVRISTKNRQRLPPEIRDSVDLDIYDDKKILSTILPSFDSLKLITENDDGEHNKNHQTRLENLKNVLNNRKDSTDASLQLKANKLESLLNGNDVLLQLKNGNDCSTKNLLNNDEVKKVPPPVPNKTSSMPKQYFGQNGHTDTGQEKPVNGQTVIPNPPPAPPVLASGNSGPKRVVPTKKMPEKQVDPREQLMQEIRKCGGRTALRKISLT